MSGLVTMMNERPGLGGLLAAEAGVPLTELGVEVTGSGLVADANHWPALPLDHTALRMSLRRLPVGPDNVRRICLRHLDLVDLAAREGNAELALAELQVIRDVLAGALNSTVTD